MGMVRRQLSFADLHTRVGYRALVVGGDGALAANLCVASYRARASAATLGHSNRAASRATPAPRNWTQMNASTLVGAIPAKVSLRPRAIVTAGLAKEVDAVNQYAAVM